MEANKKDEKEFLKKLSKAGVRGNEAGLLAKRLFIKKTRTL